MYMHKLLSLRNGSLSKNLLLKKALAFIQNPTRVSKGFIPDILNMYGLLNMINAYLNNKGLLPSKISFKLTVNTVVNAYESDNWKLRIGVDPDFSRFEQLHTAI